MGAQADADWLLAFRRTIGVTDEHDEPPEQLQRLVRAYQRGEVPMQSPIHWRRETWLRRLPEHTATFEALPSLLGRAEVRQRSEAPQNTGDALRGFLIAMVWGFGGIGYGPWRVRQALDGRPDLPEVLLEAARHAAINAVAGYRVLSEHRPPRIGPAFATKYLHFAVPITAASPLILDRFVASWIAAHAHLRLNPTRWSPHTYGRYLTCVGHWAVQLDISGALIEELIFRVTAGGQWADPLRIQSL
jgi:hypothetical protein